MRTPRRISLTVAAAVALLATATSTTAASARTVYEPQVIAGEDASAGEYPFMVALLDSSIPDNGDAFFCGGSLISATWVLTAGHCVVDSDPGDVDVLVGALDIEDGTRIAASDIIVHDGFALDTLFDDVALIELSEPVEGVTPISLAEPGTALEDAGTDLTLTGWGVTEPDGFDAATTLQEVELPVIADSTCNRELGGADLDSVLCAGAPEDDADGGPDSCYGDSGGPLFGIENGTVTQVGVVSFGVAESCGIGYSAYTRVSTYHDWIADNAGLASGPATAQRIGGANRFATAANLAAARWDGPVDVLYVVTGLAFPDALAAAAAAADVDAPVLLTATDSLPPETNAAIAILQPDRIVVVGGPGAVSDAVLRTLDGLADGGAERVAGASRYETAAELSQAGFDDLPDSVFIASGEQFADALGGAAAAAHRGAPLLLTGRDALPGATHDELGRIGPEVAYVLGGTASVSESVVAAIEAMGIRVERLAGADRYATSLTVLDELFGSSSEVVLASGTSFPDGLVGGALGSPVVLVPPSGVPASTLAALAAADAHRIVILGGTGSVPSGVEDTITASLL